MAEQNHVSPWVAMRARDTRTGKQRWKVVRYSNGVACYFHRGQLAHRDIQFRSFESAQARADQLNKEQQ